MQGEPIMSGQISQACKELIDDAKNGCAELVFKEVCLEVLSKAHNILSDKEFNQLVAYVSEKMKKISFVTPKKLVHQQ